MAKRRDRVSPRSLRRTSPSNRSRRSASKSLVDYITRVLCILNIVHVLCVMCRVLSLSINMTLQETYNDVLYKPDIIYPFPFFPIF